MLYAVQSSFLDAASALSAEAAASHAEALREVRKSLVHPAWRRLWRGWVG